MRCSGRRAASPRVVNLICDRALHRGHLATEERDRSRGGHAGDRRPRRRHADCGAASGDEHRLHVASIARLSASAAMPSSSQRAAPVVVTATSVPGPRGARPRRSRSADRHPVLEPPRSAAAERARRSGSRSLHREPRHRPAGRALAMARNGRAGGPYGGPPPSVSRESCSSRCSEKRVFINYFPTIDEQDLPLPAAPRVAAMARRRTHRSDSGRRHACRPPAAEPWPLRADAAPRRQVNRISRAERPSGDTPRLEQTLPALRQGSRSSSAGINPTETARSAAIYTSGTTAMCGGSGSSPTGYLSASASSCCISDFG